jgi:hypothetical protein
MNRAEMMRKAREEAKNDVKYELTREQIKTIKEQAVKSVEDTLMKNTVQRGVDISRALMVAVVMNVLGHEYWEKSAKKRLPKLMIECESLYESIEAGVISINELIQDTMEISGISNEYFERLQEDKELWNKLNMVAE